MKNLRTRFERFCLRNRDKGIPNLMLYITLGSGLVYIMTLLNGGSALYFWLCFDKAAILQGQIWRLVTFLFTYTPGSNPVLILVGLYFFYNISRSIELRMGTFRFNLFYFSGMFMMILFAMIFCPTSAVTINGELYPAEFFTYYVYGDFAWYLHLSMILTYCVACPDSEFLVFFILPVKAWFLSIVDLVIIAISVYNLSYPSFVFPHNLFPLVGIANFLLFAGKDVVNLLPEAIRPKARFAYKKKTDAAKNRGPIPFSSAKQTASYTHRCSVCGRTDVSDPSLEFRYCSRCNGYHCYCQDHIDNHTHVE